MSDLGLLVVPAEEKGKERAHSKFSASGAERWFLCPGSVELSEGQPDKSSPWAIEGTWAHGVLETLMRRALKMGVQRISSATFLNREVDRLMIAHGIGAANFILGLHHRTPDSDITVETRIYLDFIHEEMFGTYDGAVIDYFDTLHVFDYKFGAGHAVSPKENLQMIFYGVGLGHKYKWNFKRVRLWIIQPRIRGYDGPLFWDIPIEVLKAYVADFQKAVDRVLETPDLYVEGSHCHWCKAKAVCPLKRDAKVKQAQSIFGSAPLKPVTKERPVYGEKEESKIKSEAEWKAEARRKKGPRKTKSFSFAAGQTEVEDGDW